MRLCQLPITENSKISNLALIYTLFRWKDKTKATDAATRVVLGMIKWVTGDGHRIPTYVMCSRILSAAGGCSSKSIDACPNDCMLYSGEHAQARRCVVCKQKRGFQVGGTSL